MTLDPAQDPDRYDAGKDASKADAPAGPLDPTADPDRYSPTLPELLGEGSFEDERDPQLWIYGLLGIFGFLALFSLAIYFAPR